MNPRTEFEKLPRAYPDTRTNGLKVPQQEKRCPVSSQGTRMSTLLTPSSSTTTSTTTTSSSSSMLPHSHQYNLAYSLFYSRSVRTFSVPVGSSGCNILCSTFAAIHRLTSTSSWSSFPQPSNVLKKLNRLYYYYFTTYTNE